MNIRFQIAYRTVWGESVSVSLTTLTKGGREVPSDLSLSTRDGELWGGEALLPPSAASVRYQYCIVRDGQVTRREWDMVPRTLSLPKGVSLLACTDRWRDQPSDAYRYTSAFTEAFEPHAVQGWSSLPGPRRLVLRVFAPEVPEGQVLAVLGNHPLLGQWQCGHEVRLRQVAPCEWAMALERECVTGALEYKFLTVDAATGRQGDWEEHANRVLPATLVGERETRVVEIEPVRFCRAPWRAAGCVVPVFSLRSEHSFGVGDFGDLRRMVDWAALTGMHVLQILPINDTTQNGRWTDSYPYNSISIFALHPLYADLEALPPLQDAAQRTLYRAAQKKLNAQAALDYERVIDTKRNYLRRLFRQEWPRVKDTAEYKHFLRHDGEWLLPYAAFCYLRDKFGTADFRQWPVLSVYDAKELHKLSRKDPEFADGMDENCYIQYVLHTQLKSVRDYARKKGVVLKGDIPIGISPSSVEAWTEPHYFHFDGQAGAPPDFFSQNGQNWGFPTYNWERMLEDGCLWWRRRFEKMAEYFDAYRIDHVLGFFRIWEIPQHSVHGLLGQFSPALPMSVDEIEHFGLPWRGETYTQPYITDRILLRVFGDLTPEVRHLYLEPGENGRYRLREEFNTQRKVQAAFADRADAHSVQLRDGLYRLISNVLFVADRKQPQRYHPRIVAMHDLLYEDLSYWEKDAFNRIHEHFFHHRHNQFWYDESMKKLPCLVRATRMLVCAEDLGMVPECVAWVMNQLGILSLEIQTMPKHGWGQFANLWENPYRSVATISTHDMPTLRQWWDEQREAAQNYYNHVLGHEGQAPHPMPGDVAREVVSRYLESPSMLCLLSLQDWLAMDETLRNPDPKAERINEPANPRHYWQWRMHLPIEHLMSQTGYTEKVRSLIKAYGR